MNALSPSEIDTESYVSTDTESYVSTDTELCVIRLSLRSSFVPQPLIDALQRTDDGYVAGANQGGALVLISARKIGDVWQAFASATGNGTSGTIVTTRTSNGGALTMASAALAHAWQSARAIGAMRD